MKKEKDQLLEKNDWKKTNKRYLFELQKFLDLLDNIEQENLRKELLYQFMQYDKTITDIVENILEDKN